jgi:N-acyl-D-aspartate/D-glutamate deacylase
MRLPCLVLLASAMLSAADYDLLIRNARVVDGTGNDSRYRPALRGIR